MNVELDGAATSTLKRARPGAVLRSVWTIDLVICVALMALSLLIIRPLVEEIGFDYRFDVSGLGAVGSMIDAAPLRPLQPLPFVVQWLLGAGVLGHALGSGCVVVGRYIALRWALKDHVSRGVGMVVGVMGAVLVTWPADWFLRYSAGQLGTCLLFVAVGSNLRAQRSRLNRWTVITVLCVALAVCCYPGVTGPTVLVALPALGLVARTGRRVGGYVRAAGPVAAGLALYGIYATVVTEVHGAGYEAAATTNHPFRSAQTMIDALSSLYRTAYFNAPTEFALAGLCVVAVVWVGSPSSVPVRRVLWALVMIVGLPLLAFPYAANLSFLNDPERVLLPVSVGLVLICAWVAVGREPFEGSTTRSLVPIGIAAVLLGSAAANGYSSWHDYSIQNRILDRAAAALKSSHATSVRIRDYSGQLGDVYTFAPTILWMALENRGVHVTEALICAPDGIDRSEPEFQRLLMPAQEPRCSALPAPTGPVAALDIVTSPTGNDFDIRPGAAW